MNKSLFVNGKFSSQIRNVTRFAHQGQKVLVYRNLNKPAFYSIMAAEGADKNKVIGYAKSVLLSDVSFKVSEKVSKRVKKEKRRNVHAYCVGTLQEASNIVLDDPNGIVATYSPYVCHYFFVRGTEQLKHEDAEPVNERYESALLQGADVYLD